MKVIDVELSSILDGVTQLEDLKASVKQSGISIPSMEGSGNTAQAIYALAESFLDLENTWELLLEESISFFKKVEDTHESLQEKIVDAINVIVKDRK